MSLARQFRVLQAARLAASQIQSSRSGGTTYPDLHTEKPSRGLTDQDMQSIRAWPDPFDHRGWKYRAPYSLSDTPITDHVVGTFLSACFWFWMFYNFYWDSPMVFGEYRVPDPLLFSNAELGIPPDDF